MVLKMREELKQMKVQLAEIHERSSVTGMNGSYLVQPPDSNSADSIKEDPMMQNLNLYSDLVDDSGKRLDQVPIGNMKPIIKAIQLPQTTKYTLVRKQYDNRLLLL